VSIAIATSKYRVFINKDDTDPISVTRKHVKHGKHKIANPTQLIFRFESAPFCVSL
jgi:hypothetical protein